MTETATQVVRIGIADLSRRLGVDRSTIWRWYRAGRFPAPHYLGERRMWIIADVEAWERERMAREPGSRRSSRNYERLRGRSASAKDAVSRGLEASDEE